MDETKFLATRSSLLDRMKNEEDQQSWLEFYNTYWKLIYNAARKSGLKDPDAQDVVQETVLTVLRKIKEFEYNRDKGSFKGWLKVITRSRIMDHWRKCSRQPGKNTNQGTEREASDLDESIPDPGGFELEKIWEQEWRSNIHSIALDRVKQQVSAQQFQIFDCYVLKEWSVGEIKSKLHFSSGQIYMAKHRVGKLFKQELQLLMEEEV
jgi:RNA polymerase sigma-70 factor (ECF subfamily)